MFAWVYELLHSQWDFGQKNLDVARENVHTMIREVILGQMIDVHLIADKPASREVIEKKTMYKTSFYTFVRPMLTGANFS
jgi:geranylgeranyl pyrophosphate synthase